MIHPRNPYEKQILRQEAISFALAFAGGCVLIALVIILLVNNL